jgi:hypothetical protein
VKLLKQVVLGSLPLTGNNRAAEQEERVLDLFRNRIELKKAYIALQAELQNYRDRLKQQEGTLARAQECMEALETRLTQPESGATTLVYYQLRHFWNGGMQLLERFVDERRIQRESLEREQFQRGAQLEGIRRMATVDAALNLASATAGSARATVQELGLLLQRSGSWWQYFKRRDLRRRIAVATGQAAIADMELNTVVAEREALAATAEPEFPGLSLASKRSINSLAIAYAHVLQARLSDSPVFEAASKAIRLREPPDGDYGDFNACRQMMKEIQRARAVLVPGESLREELQSVLQRLADKSRYATEDSSVPEVDALLGSDAAAGTRALKENYWQVSKLLLR